MAAADLTLARLREVLTYNPDTGLFYRNRWPHKGPIGTPDSWGHLQAKVDNVNHLLHRLAWLWVYGVWPDHQVDHRNRIKSDNRIDNLRDATQTVNQQNQAEAHAGNPSGLLGVHFYKRSGRYVAHITVDGRQRHLGVFDDPELAHTAYLEAKRRLHAGCTI